MLELITTDEILYTICTILIFFAIYFLVKQTTKRYFAKVKRKNNKYITIHKMLKNIFRDILIVLAFLIILSIWGVDTKAMIASLGLAGVIAGLASQDILKDILAGIAIVVDNEFNVGDNIKIGTFRGTVTDMGLRSTKIRAYSGEVMTIANRNITNIINYSTQSSRCIVDIGVNYNSDLEKVEKVLNEVCKKLTEQTPYLTSEVTLLGLEKLDDSAMLYRIIADCKPVKDIGFKREVHKEVKLAFDKNKLDIPYMQVVVHNEK